MLQLVLGNLLVPEAQRERNAAFQSVAQGEEPLQVVVLEQQREGLLWSRTQKRSIREKMKHVVPLGEAREKTGMKL